MWTSGSKPITRIGQIHSNRGNYNNVSLQWVQGWGWRKLFTFLSSFRKHLAESSLLNYRPY